MAALTEERYRPEDTKAVKGPKRGSFAKHKTRSSSDAVKQSEQSLRHLLEDFEEGRLNAFGNSDMLQRMNEIREMQEKLTLKHFEIDQVKVAQESSSSASSAATAQHSGEEKSEEDDASLFELTQQLEKLGVAIQNLHSSESLSSARAGALKKGSGKKVTVKTDHDHEAGDLV